jgi:tetraacyldisaccharide 4'-kinase
MTIYLARRLQQAGMTPLIVSRGYRGSASAEGGLVSNGRDILMTADRSGDEPLLMARRLADVPVAVGRKRYDIAMQAVNRFSPDVVLLDDGFQHFQLARDIDIVLLDNARPLGNRHLLPAGPLREPLTTIRLADIIVFTRSDNPGAGHPRRLKTRISDKPAFYACHTPVITHWIAFDTVSPPEGSKPGIEALANRRAFVFSGLADNPSFLNSLRQRGVEIAGHRFFRDHHDYTPADLDEIFRAARKSAAELTVTSGKDYVKFSHQRLPELSCDFAVLDAGITFKDQADRFESLIFQRINAARNRLR